MEPFIYLEERELSCQSCTGGYGEDCCTAVRRNIGEDRTNLLTWFEATMAVSVPHLNDADEPEHNEETESGVAGREV